MNNPSTKKKKPNNGYFRYTLIFLIWTSIMLSICTLIISWVAIQKDSAKKMGLQGGGDGESDFMDAPHPIGMGPPPKKKHGVHLRNQGISNKKIIPKAVFSTSKEGPTNSELYQPPPTGKRLLTYKRFGGRLNNQLFQFITALQHAKVLKRTFVVPDEMREVDWTGMFDTSFGIWDLTSLNAAYDIDWTSGLSSSDFVVPEECVLTPKDGRLLLNGGIELWEKWDKKCPDVIDLAGNTGLLFCERQHQFCGDAEAQMEAYQIYSHLHLSHSLLQYIPSKSEEFKDQGYDALAVHSRRAGEGGYDWELCIKGNYRTCAQHLPSADSDKYCDVRTMKGNCAPWLDLDYQIKSKKATKKNEKDYKFVLASDGTHDWSIDFKGQFIVANNTDWLLAMEKKAKDNTESIATSKFVKEKLKGQKDLHTLRGTLDALTATLLDLFSLVDSTYLMGAYYSTLSLNACFFRGLDRMYDSNMCWLLMHPTTRVAIPPPLEDAVHIDGDVGLMNNLPAALMSDVEHAFVRSNDGNFLAIDRYLIHHLIPGQKRPRQVIGVLGDGLVPITIKRNEAGEETINADFTCSMGDQLNSPATVILMKGDKSYQEHYYERGEKYNTPYSTNGDRFRTLIILCEELQFDKSLPRHPPLVLKSPDGKFSISIGSTFARTLNKGDNQKRKDGDKNGRELVHCLNPVYGLKDPRWVIEYLEYHRAIGVSHVHVYNVDLHSPEMQSVFQAYRHDRFVTRHDWSDKASKGYTTHKTYEHAKWAAQTDCVLRNRGAYDYALFSDIDEVLMVGNPEGHIGAALDACDAASANDENPKIACSFNSNTVTSIYTKPTDKEELTLNEKLLLERYDRVEASPHCPANCKCLGNSCKEMTRKFHTGRQKYMANVGDLSIPPRPMWTHAVARNYDEMDMVMEVLPDDVMHVRHYQGHWYLNKNLLDTVKEVYAPLQENIMITVRRNIMSNREVNEIYTKAKKASKSTGVEWITPVVRAPQYHHKLL